MENFMLYLLILIPCVFVLLWFKREHTLLQNDARVNNEEINSIKNRLDKMEFTMNFASALESDVADLLKQIQNNAPLDNPDNVQPPTIFKTADGKYSANSPEELVDKVMNDRESQSNVEWDNNSEANKALRNYFIHVIDKETKKLHNRNKD